MSQEQINAYLQSLKTLDVLQSIEQVDVGTAEKELVFSQDKLRLYRFVSTQKKKNITPILIVYALVNRYYMMDLDQERSLIRRLLEQGMDVYLIDWGYPDPADRMLDMDDYVNGYLADSVEAVKKDSGFEQINILGVCQGGTLSLCYSAIYPQNIKNIITMVTPVDFSAGNNTLRELAQYIDMELVSQALGNTSGDEMNRSFASLNPITLNYLKFIKANKTMADKEKALFFLRMEKWINDSPDQAGRMICEFVSKNFQANLLIKGQLQIGDDIVDLANITQPVLNIFGAFDHIVPPQASKALGKYIKSSDYTEAEFKSGHIGIYVSSKCNKEIPQTIATWVSDHNA